MPVRHIPVMPEEVLARLAPKPGEVYVDCTAGLGGHAAIIAREVTPGGTVVLNDADGATLALASGHVRQEAGTGVRVECVHGNFALLPNTMAERGLKADMVLADLGFSSAQVETPERGFSFQRDGPLDMRLDPSRGVTAAELVSSLSEQEIARILDEYGEERAARRIARKLVEVRARGPIDTTLKLAQVVRAASAGGGGRGGGIDPATRTFQALRIAVNDELGSLEALLAQITADQRWLGAKARVAFLTFHSLEDRLVKRAFQRIVESGLGQVEQDIISASEGEVEQNPRARSAKLRVVRLVGLVGRTAR